MLKQHILVTNEFITETNLKNADWKEVDWFLKVVSYFNKNVSISVYLWISFCKYILQPVDIVKRVKRKQRIRKDFLMFY